MNLGYLRYMAWRHGLTVTRIKSEWVSVSKGNKGTTAYLPSFPSRFRGRIQKFLKDAAGSTRGEPG
jgi:hypothetical protein